MSEEKRGKFQFKPYSNYSGLAVENPDDFDQIVRKAQEYFSI